MFFEQSLKKKRKEKKLTQAKYIALSGKFVERAKLVDFSVSQLQLLEIIPFP